MTKLARLFLFSIHVFDNIITEELHKQNLEPEVELKPKKLKLDEPKSSDDEEEEEIPVVPRRKRIRLVSEVSDDSDEENKEQTTG